MRLKHKLLVVCILYMGKLQAQWALQPGIGISIPITGYNTVSKAGVLYQLDITRRLQNPRWGIGLLLAWARMHRDNNPSDIFGNARLDQIPIVVSGDYELAGKTLHPYLGMGLGVSLYNLSYEVTPVSGETLFNVSFSLLPRAGVRVPVTKKFYPFLEVNCPLVMDGPPIGAGKAEKATGYVGVALGTAYRL